MEQFKTRMNESKYCIIIGYGFWDEHVNDEIKEFLKNPNNRIMIIDFFEGNNLFDYGVFQRFNNLMPEGKKFVNPQNVYSKPITSINQDDLINEMRSYQLIPPSFPTNKEGWFIQNRVICT